MKLAIIILLVIAVASLLSMFLVELYPMRAGFPGWESFYKERYGMGDGVFALFKYLELYDPYRSWWFRILLGALALSLVACLVNRIPVAVRQAFSPQYRSRPADLSILPKYQHWSGSFDRESFLRSLKKRFRVFIQQDVSSTVVYGTRGWLNLFGPIGIHLGMLLLALGGLWISLLGTSISISGFSGDIINIPGENFRVRIDDFRIEYYPLNPGQIVLINDGHLGRTKQKLSDTLFAVERMSPHGVWFLDTLKASDLSNQFDLSRDQGNIKDYLCDLTLMENDSVVRTMTVEVNHPLRYKRYRFYQSSYDADHPRIEASYDSLGLMVTRTSDQTILDTLWLQPHRKAHVPETPLQVAVTDFQPDFRITEDRVTSVSARMDNPAVKLVYSQGDSTLYHQWSFLNRQFHHTESELPVSLQFVDIRNPIARQLVRTVIQVRRSPGTELIWIGFIVATVGLVFAFYVGFHRVWAVVIPHQNNQADIHIAMTSRRGSTDWEQRFQRLVEELKSPSQRS